MPIGLDNIFITQKNKRNSEFGTYYLMSTKGDIYSNKTGYLMFKLIFEEIEAYCLTETYIGMGVNILIRIYFPADTISNLLKDNNMFIFFQKKEVYNSLPEKYQWYKMGESEVEDILEGSKTRLRNEKDTDFI